MKREIFETTQDGVYCCPVELKDEIVRAGAVPIKIGRKWFYFEAGPRWRADSLNNCPMPMVLVFGYSLPLARL